MGENVPVPKVVHTPLPVVEVPLSAALGLLMQTEIVVPAFTRGASVIVTTMVSVTEIHSPLPVVVSIIFTLPAAVSAALGVYVPFMSVMSEKLPVPLLVDQLPPVATVNDPFSVTTALLAHTVWFTPAFAVGAGVIVTVIWSVTAKQPPFPVEVIVSAMLPAVLSAEVGV